MKKLLAPTILLTLALCGCASLPNSASTQEEKICSQLKEHSKIGNINNYHVPGSNRTLEINRQIETSTLFYKNSCS